MKDENQHRRLVHSSLPDSCELQDTLTIENILNGLKKLFNRIMSYTREENLFSKGLNFTYWYGEDADDGSTFNYVKDESGHILGSLVDVTNHNILQFYIDDGIQTVVITNSSDFPPEIEIDPPVGTIVDKPREDFLFPVSTEELTTSTYDDNGGNLDVLVVWSRAAECENSRLSSSCEVTDKTLSSMNSLVNLAISETNAAYEMPGIYTQLLLVHSFRLPTYVVKDFDISLSDLRNGRISSVKELREEYGADIVVLIGEKNAYCGIGYVGPSKDFMYSVTAWNCATG